MHLVLSLFVRSSCSSLFVNSFPFHRCSSSCCLVHEISAMIRLPPTAIALGPADLLDFEIRQLQDRANHEPRLLETAVDTPQGQLRHVGDPCVERLSALKGQNPLEKNIVNGRKSEELQNSSIYPEITDTEQEEAPSMDDTLPYASRHFSGGAENGMVEVQQSSPSKDDFHYGGFIENPVPCLSEHNTPMSPSFGAPILDSVNKILIVYRPRRFLYSTATASIQ